MKIVVKDLDDETADVEVKPESKVEEIATQVISKWKLDSKKRMRIMFGGRQLEYNEVVEECKLSDGDVVRILIKPKKTAEKLKDVEEDEIQTALQFGKRVKKYLNQVEGKTRDTGLFIGQSGNQSNLISRRKVQINLDTNLDEDWKKVFKEAAAKIVKAATGIELIIGESFKTIDLNERKTIYVITDQDDSISTKGNIIDSSESTISVFNDLKANRLNMALHTMMLALGFEHGDSSVSASQTLSFEEHLSSFAKIRKIVLQSCSIDGFSVMTANSNATVEMKGEVKIWSLDNLVQAESKQILSKNLSELDKVALNIVYPPVKISGEYDPMIKINELYYCSRKIMENHNRPNKVVIDNVGRPESGPNCPSCRTFSTAKIEELNAKGIFQASTGMFYGGNKMEKRIRDKVAKGSPDNPLPCKNCLDIFYDGLTILKLTKPNISPSGGIIF